MALKNCKECGHQVSKKADTCPNCGVKNPAKKTIPKPVIALINIGMIAFFIYLFTSGGGVDINSQADGFSTLSLNVREQPSTDYEVVTTLEKGEQVEFLKDSVGWKQIRTLDDNTIGWASGNYLKSIDEIESWMDDEEQKQAQANAPSWDEENAEIDAYLMCMEFVKDRLKAPSTAEFQSIWDGRYDNVYKINQVYLFNSYVDAQNSFGAQIRNHFKCKIKQVSEGKWTLQELEMN